MTGPVVAGRGGRGDGRGHLIRGTSGEDHVTSVMTAATAFIEEIGRLADARERCLIVGRGEFA